MLIAYSPDTSETIRRIAHYVDRILKGAKPSELPVELPSKFKLAAKSKSLQFAEGASSATVKGTLKGDSTIDYKLRARAGRTMTVSLKGSNAATYFNVLPPGSNDVAIYNSSMEGNDWKVALPSDGEYKVRVSLTGDAKVKGTPNHTTGKVRCGPRTPRTTGWSRSTTTSATGSPRP